MKMKMGQKWIAVTVVLCVVAVVLIVTRQKAGTGQETASGEDRRLLHTIALSERASKATGQESPARHLPESETAGDPTSLETGNAEPRNPNNGHRAATPDSAPATREAGATVSDGIGRQDPDETPLDQLASPPPGIQLAPEVRLPVAALPVDFETNDVTARMLDLIVADYYSDLAAGVSQDEAETQSSRLSEENGETTILVRNGPAAEAARQRADWRFRTIFGKDAFNRMSMQSNLEARLPVGEATNGDE